MGKKLSVALAGLFVGLGILATGYLMANALIDFKKMDRVVTVKGLAEREVKADIAIFPIRFNTGSDQLDELYKTITQQTSDIKSFLLNQGFKEDEITTGAPTIFDKQAQQYGGERGGFRYTANITVNVYTSQVDKVIETRKQLIDLTEKGIVINSDDYMARTEFLFSGLNDIKPAMIEEATQNARMVADKFAQDSNSALGKLRTASQGQFSISDRDSNTPHIKNVRVVSTLQYYLVD